MYSRATRQYTAGSSLCSSFSEMGDSFSSCRSHAMLFSYPLPAFDPEDDLVDVDDLDVQVISLKHPTIPEAVSPLSKDFQNE